MAHDLYEQCLASRGAKAALRQRLLSVLFSSRYLSAKLEQVMNISGILVVVPTDNLDTTVTDLNALPGVEVHHVDPAVACGSMGRSEAHNGWPFPV